MAPQRVKWSLVLAAGAIWAGFWLFMSIMLVAMRGLGDEPGRPFPLKAALILAAIPLLVAVPGALLARLAFRKLRAANKRDEDV